MVPEIGKFALTAAFAAAGTQAVLPALGASRGDPWWTRFAKSAAVAQCLLLVTAFGCLAWSFLSNDFSVLNVAQNSSSLLPLHYRFTATWGSHEGSLLLWNLILGLWTGAVALFSRRLPEAMLARVLAVMGAISCGFLLFILLTSNPFILMDPAPLEGRDLNPLLQDPAMIAHPPILYMGYVGFSVAFAFAIAALIGGDIDASWAAWCRPWTTVAWIFLTCGIALGSFWAYYELGWGGWWFWDPVENASFMPWLAGTALIHSLAVTERRGTFKSWTVLLAIAAFSLSLLGTFLVRSGVLTSVHAFASDPKRGIFILCFLALVVGGSLLLYAVRARRLTTNQTFSVISRESMLLSNNVLLVVAAASILLGTLYPLVIDVLGMGKLSVGPPYFNAIFVSVMTPAMFLLGVGPIARWKSARAPELAIRLRWAFVVSLTAGLVVPFFLGAWKPLVALGLSLAVWILASIAVSFRERLRNGGFGTLPRSYYGMQLAHAGVAVFILGVTLVSGYEVEHDTRMEPGETVRVANYDFTLKRVSADAGANYIAAQADFEVADSGSVRMMRPEKRVYRSSTNLMTEAAIDSGVFRDLYIALGEPVEHSGWTVRIQYKPFVNWIWAGALLMAIGGALSLRRGHAGGVTGK